MAQSTISIRVDEDMKKRVEYLADAFGMNLTTLISVFLKAVEREQEIPFKISARDDMFFAHSVNKRYLDEAFSQFRAGKTTPHELLEVEDA